MFKKWQELPAFLKLYAVILVILTPMCASGAYNAITDDTKVLQLDAYVLGPIQTSYQMKSDVVEVREGSPSIIGGAVGTVVGVMMGGPFPLVGMALGASAGETTRTVVAPPTNKLVYCSFVVGMADGTKARFVVTEGHRGLEQCLSLQQGGSVVVTALTSKRRGGSEYYWPPLEGDGSVDLYGNIEGRASYVVE